VLFDYIFLPPIGHLVVHVYLFVYLYIYLFIIVKNNDIQIYSTLEERITK